MRTSFKTWAWFFKIVVGFLHGPVFLFKLRLFVIVATSFSLARFTENEFITFFLNIYYVDIFLLLRFGCKVGVTIAKKDSSTILFLVVTIFPFIVVGSD